jgi:hypothetical protein
MDLPLMVSEICNFSGIMLTKANNVDPEVFLVSAGFSQNRRLAKDEGDIVWAVKNIKFVASNEHRERLPPSSLTEMKSAALNAEARDHQ